MFWFFGWKTYGILALQPGMLPEPLHLEAKCEPLDLQGCPRSFSLDTGWKEVDFGHFLPHKQAGKLQSLARNVKEERTEENRTLSGLAGSQHSAAALAGARAPVRQPDLLCLHPGCTRRIQGTEEDGRPAVKAIALPEMHRSLTGACASGCLWRRWWLALVGSREGSQLSEAQGFGPSLEVHLSLQGCFTKPRDIQKMCLFGLYWWSSDLDSVLLMQGYEFNPWLRTICHAVWPK